MIPTKKDQKLDWGIPELTIIRSRAIALMQELRRVEDISNTRVDGDSDISRTYCFAQATFEFLRSLNLISVIYQLRRGKDPENLCNHSKITYSPATEKSPAKYFCPGCGQYLRPILWGLDSGAIFDT